MQTARYERPEDKFWTYLSQVSGWDLMQEFLSSFFTACQDWLSERSVSILTLISFWFFILLRPQLWMCTSTIQKLSLSPTEKNGRGMTELRHRSGGKNEATWASRETPALARVVSKLRLRCHSTLRAPFSGIFLQRKDVVKQCLEFGVTVEDLDSNRGN